jgi:hypothetical protein
VSSDNGRKQADLQRRRPWEEHLKGSENAARGGSRSTSATKKTSFEYASRTMEKASNLRFWVVAVVKGTMAYPACRSAPNLRAAN